MPHVYRTNADPNILRYGTSHNNKEGAEEEEEEESSSDSENDDGPTSDIPHVAKRSGPITLPAVPHGLFFPRLIRIGPDCPCPHFDEKGMRTLLSEWGLVYFFSRTNFEAILGDFRQAAVMGTLDKNCVKN